MRKSTPIKNLLGETHSEAARLGNSGYPTDEKELKFSALRYERLPSLAMEFGRKDSEGRLNPLFSGHSFIAAMKGFNSGSMPSVATTVFPRREWDDRPRVEHKGEYGEHQRFEKTFSSLALYVVATLGWERVISMVAYALGEGEEDFDSLVLRAVAAQYESDEGLALERLRCFSEEYRKANSWERRRIEQKVRLTGPHLLFDSEMERRDRKVLLPKDIDLSDPAELFTQTFGEVPDDFEHKKMMGDKRGYAYQTRRFLYQVTEYAESAKNIDRRGVRRSPAQIRTSATFFPLLKSGAFSAAARIDKDLSTRSRYSSDSSYYGFDGHAYGYAPLREKDEVVTWTDSEGETKETHIRGKVLYRPGSGARVYTGAEIALYLVLAAAHKEPELFAAALFPEGPSATSELNSVAMQQGLYGFVAPVEGNESALSDVPVLTKRGHVRPATPSEMVEDPAYVELADVLDEGLPVFVGKQDELSDEAREQAHQLFDLDDFGAIRMNGPLIVHSPGGQMNGLCTRDSVWDVIPRGYFNFLDEMTKGSAPAKGSDEVVRARFRTMVGGGQFKNSPRRNYDIASTQRTGVVVDCVDGVALMTIPSGLQSIRINAKHRVEAITIDVDGRDGLLRALGTGAELLPNMVVENNHKAEGAHVTYFLNTEDGVSRGTTSKRAPQRLLRVVKTMLDLVLGGDPASKGEWTKNPTNPNFTTTVLSGKMYGLKELRDAARGILVRRMMKREGVTRSQAEEAVDREVKKRMGRDVKFTPTSGEIDLDSGRAVNVFERTTHASRAISKSWALRYGLGEESRRAWNFSILQLAIHIARKASEALNKPMLPLFEIYRAARNVADYRWELMNNPGYHLGKRNKSVKMWRDRHKYAEREYAKFLEGGKGEKGNREKIALEWLTEQMQVEDPYIEDATPFVGLTGYGEGGRILLPPGVKKGTPLYWRCNVQMGNTHLNGAEIENRAELRDLFQETEWAVQFGGMEAPVQAHVAHMDVAHFIERGLEAVDLSLGEGEILLGALNFERKDMEVPRELEDLYDHLAATLMLTEEDEEDSFTPLPTGGVEVTATGGYRTPFDPTPEELSYEGDMMGEEDIAELVAAATIPTLEESREEVMAEVGRVAYLRHNVTRLSRHESRGDPPLRAV